jgi:WD40 repeat protein
LTVVGGTKDGQLVVWGPDSEAVCQVLDGHRARVTHIEIKRVQERPLAISGSADRTARVWDLLTGECVQIFKEHLPGEALRGVALSDDGEVAVTAGTDSTVRLWDVSSGECLDLYKAGEPVTCLSRIDKSNRFVCGTGCGDVQFLAIRDLPAPAPTGAPFGVADRCCRAAG